MSMNDDILEMTIAEIFLSMQIASGMTIYLENVQFIKYFLKEFNLTITQLIKHLEKGKEETE